MNDTQLSVGDHVKRSKRSKSIGEVLSLHPDWGDGMAETVDPLAVAHVRWERGSRWGRYTYTSYIGLSELIMVASRE